MRYNADMYLAEDYAVNFGYVASMGLIGDNLGMIFSIAVPD